VIPYLTIGALFGIVFGGWIVFAVRDRSERKVRDLYETLHRCPTCGRSTIR